MNKTPFIKKFETKEKKYIYDVNSNAILEVDDVVYDIVDFYYLLSHEELINKFKKEYSPKLIRRGITAIEGAIKKNRYFSYSRPIKMGRFSKKQIRKELANNVKTMTFAVTEDCNLRCTYCPYSGKFKYVRKHNPKRMSFDTAKRAIDFLKGHSKNIKKIRLIFYGGEPLLNFPLIEYCINYSRDIFKNKKITFNLTTNATLLSEHIMRFLIRNNVKVAISLDGPSRVHDLYRIFPNGKGTYKLIIQKLNKLQKLSPKYFLKNVDFISILTPPYNLLPTVNYFYKSYKGKQTVLVHPVNIEDSFIFQDFKREDSLYSKSFKKIKRKLAQALVENKKEDLRIPLGLFGDRLLKIDQLQPDKLGKEIDPNGICIPGTMPFVDPDGKMYVCQRIEYNLCIGNIYAGFDYKKIYKIILDYIKLSEKDCLSCWYCRFCKACFVPATRNNKLDYNKKKRYCEAIKKLFLDSLIFYYSVLEKDPRGIAKLSRWLKTLSSASALEIA